MIAAYAESRLIKVTMNPINPLLHFDFCAADQTSTTVPNTGSPLTCRNRR